MPEFTDAQRLAMARELVAEVFPEDISYRPQVTKLADRLLHVINKSKASQPERTVAVVGLLADLCSKSPEPMTSADMISLLLHGWVTDLISSKAKH